MGIGFFGKSILNGAKSIAKRDVVAPISDMVDANLQEVVTTIGSFVIRSIRGKFQRSISFTIGISYSDYWMEDALYGILYRYNNIRSMSRLELKNSRGNDGSAMYCRLDDGTHNLKYRDYDILLVIQTSSQTNPVGGRVKPVKIYTVITYHLGEDFVINFERDMVANRNSLLKIKKDSPTVNIYQDYHESDGFTYWQKVLTIPKRRLGTVYLPMDQKRRIVNAVNEFFASKEYYHRHGIAHNLKILLYGPPGPQPLSEPIMMADGSIKTFGDLEVNDEVFSHSGSPSRIMEIYDYSECDIYELRFEHGMSTKCAIDHKFPFMRGEESIEMSVGEMFTRWGRGIKGLNLTLPVCHPVEYNGISDLMYSDRPGYEFTMGVLIGSTNVSVDGETLVMSFENDRMFVKLSRGIIRDILVKYGTGIDVIMEKCFDDNCGNSHYQLFVKLDGENSHIMTMMELCDNMEDFEYNPANHKITVNFMKKSPEARFRILQGIACVSGWIGSEYPGKSVPHFRIGKAFDMKPIRRLIGDLGICHEINARRVDLFPSSMHQLSAIFKFTIFYRDIILGNLSKKFSIDYESGKLRLISIEYAGREKVRCIHIDDDSHIYLTGGEYLIPTFNSGKDSVAKMIASEWNRNLYYVTGGKDGKFVPSALTDDSDDDFSSPLLLISDIDKYPYLISEPKIDMDDPSLKDERIKHQQSFGSMINALDGVLSGEGRIIVMTTNHIEKFSDVFLRDGRVDIKEEIGYVTPEVFRKYCHDFYNYDLPEDIELVDKELTVAKLQTDVVFRKLDCNEFIKKHVATNKK